MATTPATKTPCPSCRLEGADHYLDIALSLVSFVDHWAWAMSTTDEDSNVTPEGFTGLGRLAQHLREVLTKCQAALDQKT